MKSALAFRLAAATLVLAACGSDEPTWSAPPDTNDAGSSGTVIVPNEPVATDAGSAEAQIGLEVVGGALFQGVKLPLFGDDATEKPIPVVVNRAGVLRVYVKVLDAAKAHETHVTFSYKDRNGAVQTLSGVRTIHESSSDDNAESCIDVALPADVFHPALAYQVEVRTGADRLVARFPEAEGTLQPLPADPRSQSVRVVVVPVQYTADGSGRLPDTGPEQLERMSEKMRALYPVSEVKLSVRSAPLAWNTAIGAGGEGWDDLLYGILQLREADNVAGDVYYYGAFSPGASFGEFCATGSFGCVLGLSELSRTVQDAGRRGSIGLGYGGAEAAETFTHELGHAHGRYHAPCGGAGGPDRKFPYPQGGIGVPGWDVRTASFVPVGTRRSGTKDFMGYCSPAWVSDYTWSALFARIVGVSEEAAPSGGPIAALVPVRYQLLRVEAGKAPRWLGARSVRGSVSDDAVAATLANGSTAALPQVELDHLPGHVIYVPQTLAGQTIRIKGVAAAVTVP